LFPCGDQRRVELPEILGKTQKFNLHEIITYITKEQTLLELGKPDWIVFFSPSGVKSTIKQSELLNIKIASIGATTAAEINELLNKRPHAVANKPNAVELLKAIQEYYK